MNQRLATWKSKGTYFDYRGNQIFYLKEGVGPVLLMLHGYPLNTYDWRFIWGPLAAKYTLVAPDMLGMGFSDKPTQHTYSCHDHADMHEALMEHLGLSECHILSHDLANSVVQELLSRDLEGKGKFRIHSVGFLNGGLFPDEYEPRLIQKILSHSPKPLGRLISKLITPTIFNRSISEVFGPQTKPNQEELSDYWDIITFNKGKSITHLVGRFIVDRKTHQQRWLNALQKTSIPMRYIDGPFDPNSGLHMANAYKKFVPNPDVIILDDAIGHWPQIEDPEATLKAYMEFRAGTWESCPFNPHLVDC